MKKESRDVIGPAGVRFERVWKTFGDRSAVRDLTLDIEEGEFVVLIGPSGCGKTTSLRMLAGLDRPSHGRIYIGDTVVNRIPAKDRQVGMVFQSYALFPHLSVFGNLAFGLKIRGVGRAQIEKEIHGVADLLGIRERLGQRPRQLSGGERQRVALGRAMLRRPRVLLMDEPLSNLDAAMRAEMRVELRRLHARLGMTTLYVTHDQVEAMAMGDRIGVMADGSLLQLDTLDVLYDRPANLFVGTFIGFPRMNVLRGEIREGSGQGTFIACLGQRIPLPAWHGRPDTPRVVSVGIRPADVVSRERAPAGGVEVRGVVEAVERMGTEDFVSVNCNDERVKARFPPRAPVAEGETVHLVIDPTRVHVFDPDSGANLRLSNGEIAPTAELAVTER
jgi:multiple sugar transport system ATP-binding protein